MHRETVFARIAYSEALKNLSDDELLKEIHDILAADRLLTLEDKIKLELVGYEFSRREDTTIST